MTLKAIKESLFPTQATIDKMGPYYSHTPLTEELRDRLIDDFFQEQRKILAKKSNDYAGEDLLSNFRLAGMIVNQRTECPDAMNCLNLIGTKVARLGQLLSSNKSTQNESVQDSVIDLANYTVLLHLILKLHK